MRIDIPPDFATRVQRLRARHGLNQKRFAELMGVTPAAVNHWENGRVRPSASAWQRIALAERMGIDALLAEATVGRAAQEPLSDYRVETADEPRVDFSTHPEVVRTIVEGYRLEYGYLTNPAFAAETSLIDALPHQRIAVYEHMLPQPRLRFLLADDAGAGKTIMAGLYLREMLSRRLLHRVLIVTPAGLLGNWRRELFNWFQLEFRIVVGGDATRENPFVGPRSDQLLVSVDTLSGEKMFGRLQEPHVAPYDLVIFDEAHKLAAYGEADFGVRKTDRYCLGEALAGVDVDDARWRLDSCPRHLLLLTATPHMGKDFPYYCLWRLLEPEVLPTQAAFQGYPQSERARRFLRRTKEEMVYFDGTPLYPPRVSDTLSYDLTQGPLSEQTLYDQTTAYIDRYYNRARMLNRSAAQLAMSVFQRRLASSTYALLRSLERRLERVDSIIVDLQSGKVSMADLQRWQRQVDREARDVLDAKTGDEETAEEGQEQNELAEQAVLGAVVAVNLAELRTERNRVQRLVDLAQRLYSDREREESKFTCLREVMRDSQWRDEKMIIFTEHRDTLDFLVRRLEGLGFAGQIARIDGTLDYVARDEQVEFFRKPVEEGGARYLVATDAAGEGINLQFCWLMVNYDIPWNPARLEQRMGRIHRYGQTHSPVVILNLVAGKTREGSVLQTLLLKLERIRTELGSDKVFDVVGRLFEGVSLRQYMEMALTEEGVERARCDIEGRLTTDQVRALAAREAALFGEGGDVRKELPRLKASVEREVYHRLLPGYVRSFLGHVAPLLDLAIEGDLRSTFQLRALRQGALDPVWPAFSSYTEEQCEHMTVCRPPKGEPAIFLHPGEPVFDRLCSYAAERLTLAALRGSVFVDAQAQEPYCVHLALVVITRHADPTLRPLARSAPVEFRLVGLRQTLDGQLEECAAERLLILSPGTVPPRDAVLAARAEALRPQAEVFLAEVVTRRLADEHREALQATVEERQQFVRRGYDLQEAELAMARNHLRDKVLAGDTSARGQETKIRARQRTLAALREEALRALAKEPELIGPGSLRFVTHALVLPSRDPEERKRQDALVEQVAMQLAVAFEETAGAQVHDVSTPAGARAMGLEDYPGFDLLSRYVDGQERAIEVKGRAGLGEVDVSDNEWIRADNLGERYWLYVVYHCATPTPQLSRVWNPHSRIVARPKGGVVIDAAEVLRAAHRDF